MSIKKKINNLVSPLYNKVWHAPKGKMKERLKKACDDLPKNQRLMVVSIMLSVFVLTAFFVFGHACYRMGAGQARHAIEVEHIRQLNLPDNDQPDVPSKMNAYEAAR